MRNIRGAQLQGHRIANLLGYVYCLSAVAGDPGRQGLHAVTTQNGLNFMRIKRRRPLFDSLLQQAVNVDGIRRQITGQRRRFTQLFLVAAIFDHVHKRGDGAFRCTVGWQPGFAEQASRLLRGKLAAPVGEQGDIFASRMSTHGINKRPRAFTARCDRAGEWIIISASKSWLSSKMEIALI